MSEVAEKRAKWVKSPKNEQSEWSRRTSEASKIVEQAERKKSTNERSEWGRRTSEASEVIP
jgi:hypothetical protein